MTNVSVKQNPLEGIILDFIAVLDSYTDIYSEQVPRNLFDDPKYLREDMENVAKDYEVDQNMGYFIANYIDQTVADYTLFWQNVTAFNKGLNPFIPASIVGLGTFAFFSWLFYDPCIAGAASFPAGMLTYRNSSRRRAHRLNLFEENAKGEHGRFMEKIEYRTKELATFIGVDDLR